MKLSNVLEIKNVVYFSFLFMLLSFLMPFSAIGETPIGTQLTYDGGSKWATDWSPDGKWIAYCNQTPKCDIFIISSEGGTPQNLTQDIPGNCFSPCFTADSQEVTFSSSGSDWNNECKIMSINIVTKNTRLIMPEVAIPQGMNAFWSHDGRYLVYKKIPTAETIVYDTKKYTLLSIADGDGAYYGESCFSKDDKTVISTMDGSLYGYSGKPLFSIPLKAHKKDTTQLMVNTTGSDAAEFPDYSPDGKWLMYTVNWTQLYVLKISTGEFMPVWGPDYNCISGSFSPCGDEFCYITNQEIFKTKFVEQRPLAGFVANGSNIQHTEGATKPIAEKSILNKFALHSNFPNPFNPITTIQYDIPTGPAVTVQLKIYDIRGGLVSTLVDGTQHPGMHAITWNATDDAGRKISSGIYIYRLESGIFTQTRKMLLMK